MFILYVHTISPITTKPVKVMTDANMVAIFKDIYKELEDRNRKPTLHVLDNQCLKAVKTYIKSEC